MKRADLPPAGRLAVSIREAAAMLGYSENHFRARVLADVPVIPGSRPRIVLKDLEAWLDANKITRLGTQPVKATQYTVPTPTRREPKRAQQLQTAAAKSLSDRAERHALRRLAKP